jgi:hypothetical protein
VAVGKTHGEGAVPLALRGLHLPLRHRPLDAELALRLVEVLPPERECLAGAEARVGQRQEEGPVTARALGPCPGEEGLELVRGHGPDLPLALGLRDGVGTPPPAPRDPLRGVGEEDAVVHGIGQEHRERRPDQAHGVLRLVVKEVQVGPDSIVIKHSIPLSDHHPTPTYLLRPGDRDRWFRFILIGDSGAS